MVLERTLATQFIPGTNVKDAVDGANWTFLLPTLELGQVVCIGAPPAASLATLARRARTVVVLDSPRRLRTTGEICRRRGLSNVRLVAASESAALPLSPGSADLVVIQERLDDGWCDAVDRLLKPDGLVYRESGGFLESLLDRRTGEHAFEGSRPARLFWMAGPAGGSCSAVPLEDRATIDYFRRQRLYGMPRVIRKLRPVGRFLIDRLVTPVVLQRTGALAGVDTDGPPRYLRTIAANAGLDISRYRWGLAACGLYSSRKVLFYLFEENATAPGYIVKMTRDPAFNYRVENEYRALTLLRETGCADPDIVPRAVFFGHHGGLAIVGETILPGAAFIQKAVMAADSPHAWAAIDWLTTLGAATADRATPAPTVAQALDDLLDRFTQIYSVTAEEFEFLKAQIAAVRESRAALPLVFQHGDPGAWNLLVTPSGRVAFLDWEAAEPQGMPLWDLFYFARSFGVRLARKRGTRDSLAGFRQELLADSEFNHRLGAAIRRYCDRVSLPGELVAPLFYTCWMHRALKEATRLAPQVVETGHYVNLLRLCIKQRDASALRQLLCVD